MTKQQQLDNLNRSIASLEARRDEIVEEMKESSLEENNITTTPPPGL